MTEAELTEHFRPITEFGGYEFTLADEDARRFALQIRQAVTDMPERGAPGELPSPDYPSAAPPDERAYHAVIGTDDRTNINHLAATYPYSNTGREKDNCSVFKMYNNYTALTAAHCLHNGSNWYARKPLVFQSPHSPLPDAPEQCYARSVAGCWTSWTGTSPGCDYAVITLRGRYGAWCPDNSHAVGYLGWHTVGNCVNSIKAFLSGYPKPPPKNWTYPALVYHYREDGWTSCPSTYPDRVFYENDSSGGQSGAPLVSYFAADASWRVRGVHTGQHWGLFSGDNQGRRVNMDLMESVVLHAGF